MKKVLAAALFVATLAVATFAIVKNVQADCSQTQIDSYWVVYDDYEAQLLFELQVRLDCYLAGCEEFDEEASPSEKLAWGDEVADAIEDIELAGGDLEWAWYFHETSFTRITDAQESFDEIPPDHFWCEYELGKADEDFAFIDTNITDTIMYLNDAENDLELLPQSLLDEYWGDCGVGE